MERRWLKRIAPLTMLLCAAFLVSCSPATDSDANRSAPVSHPTPSVVVSPDGSEHVTLVIKTDVEHALMGMDGLWHDAFLPGSFTAQAGVPVTVTVLNYDGGWHSFTAPSIGLDVRLKAGQPNNPTTTTFTFTPTKSGVIPWFCKAPCDPWAMARMGYMQGAVQVLPPV